MGSKAKVAAAAALLLGGAALYLAVTQGGGTPPSDPGARLSGPIAVADAAAAGGPEDAGAHGAADAVRTALEGPAVAVRVEVRTWNGAPIDGAIVEALRPPTPEWLRDHEHDRPEPPPAAQATTDATGAVDLGLSAGRWHLIARKSGYCRAGAPDVVLRAGVRPDPVVIRLGTGHGLEGHVFEAGGRVIAGATVTAFPTSSSLVRPRTTTDAQGHYRLDGLVAGPTYVAAALPGGTVTPVETILVPEVERLDLVLRTGGVLTGRVTEQGSGQPIAGARVHVQSSGSGYYKPQAADAVTDAQGGYRIDKLGEGLIHDVTVAKDGYVQVRDVAEENNASTIPFRDGRTWTRDLVLGHGGRLAVTVRGPSGPVAGCTLMVQTMQPSAGGPPTAATDGDGRGVFAALAPGRVLVQARAEGLQQPEFPVDWWSVLTDPTGTSRCLVEVQDGGEHDLELELVRASAIAGRVLGPDQQGLAGVLVDFANAADTAAAAVTAADGSFRLAGVRPGTRVELAVTKAGYVALETPAADVPASGELAGVVFRMATAPRVHGSVRARGAALVDAFVQVSMVPAQEQQWQLEFRWANSLRQPIAADGTYDVALPRADGRFAVRAVALRLPAVTSAPVAILAGQGSYTVDLELGGGSALVGRVMALGGVAPGSVAPGGVAPGGVAPGGADPVPGARVRATWLPPGSDARGMVRGLGGAPVAAVGDGAGRFALPNLLPGRYELQVVADGFLEERTEVRVPQDGELTVSLPAALSIEGVVVYADGLPVEAGQLFPEPQPGNRDPSMSIDQFTFVAADGHFKIPRLPAGQYRIRVLPARTGRANFRSKQSGIVAAGARDVRIVVERGAVIAGRVVDGDGRGLPRIDVRASRVDNRVDIGSNVWTLRDGTFTLTGLEDGVDYTLTVNSNNLGGGIPYASLQRPNVVAGTTGLEFVLQPGLPIAGTVTDGDGRPVASVMVLATPAGSDDPFGPMARTDQGGRFEIRGLQPGSYRLAIPRAIARGLLLTGGDDVAAGTTELRLTASAGAKIAGIVVDETGAPLPGANIEAEAAPPGVHSGAWMQAQTDGTFELAGLPPDAVFDVKARMRDRVPASLRAAAGSTGLRLVLAQGLAVQGRLVDAAGGPVASVNVLFRHASSGARASARTDADGRFTVTGLVPGAWSAEAVMGITDRLVMQPCGTVQAGQRDVQLQLRE